MVRPLWDPGAGYIAAATSGKFGGASDRWLATHPTTRIGPNGLIYSIGRAGFGPENMSRNLSRRKIHALDLPITRELKAQHNGLLPR